MDDHHIAPPIDAVRTLVSHPMQHADDAGRAVFTDVDHGLQGARLHLWSVGSEDHHPSRGRQYMGGLEGASSLLEEISAAADRINDYLDQGKTAGARYDLGQQLKGAMHEDDPVVHMEVVNAALARHREEVPVLMEKMKEEMRLAELRENASVQLGSLNRTVDHPELAAATQALEHTR